MPCLTIAQKILERMKQRHVRSELSSDSGIGARVAPSEERGMPFASAPEHPAGIAEQAHRSSSSSKLFIGIINTSTSPEREKPSRFSHSKWQPKLPRASFSARRPLPSLVPAPTRPSLVTKVRSLALQPHVPCLRILTHTRSARLVPGPRP